MGVNFDMSILLEISNLGVQFGTESTIMKVIRGLSFTLKQGETLGLVGESGSGKTVSALSVLRLLPSPAGKIYSGKVLFEGIDLLTLSEEEMRKIRGKKISMVFQDPMASLNPVQKIGMQVGEGLGVHLGLGRNQIKEQTRQLLAMVGMPSPRIQMDSYPHHLSGGMRQRALIAMALACKPKLLIADEPTTALDVTMQAKIMELTKSLREQSGMSILWISHDLGVVAGLADRVAIMYAGAIVEEASVRDIYQQPRHPYTIGLLRSIPQLKHKLPDRLPSIKGSPPDIADILPSQCAFYDRCDYRLDICMNESPPLRSIKGSRKVACFLDITR